MLQQDEPDDYVIATGEAHSVRELVDVAFEHVGLDPERARADRPALPAPGRGGAPDRRLHQGREQLGWEPRTSFEEMIRLMVDSDLELLASRGAQQAGGLSVGPPAECDLAVVGGGILGLAVARELKRRRPGPSAVVLERGGSRWPAGRPAPTAA